VRAVAYTGYGVTPELVEVADPACPADGVVIAREIEIYGSHGMAARDYPALMRLVADGTLRPGQLVGDVIALEDAGRALAAMSELSATAGMTVVRLAV
jgi:alcohol dehydrogenase